MPQRPAMPSGPVGSAGGGTRPAGVGLREALASAGRVGVDLLAVDWSSTPLGPLEGWAQSLCTAVRILLSSRFSMWMAWGPQLTFVCNDAYRRDTLGSKYPWALGRPAEQVWAEIWPDIGPRIDRVLHSGEATWDEALQLFLERSGYPEETYHTFSYSPLTDDEGAVTGLLCVVSEVTERVIGERRMGTLRDLGSRLSATRSERDVVAAAADVLAGNAWCLPFTLTFLYPPGPGPESGPPSAAVRLAAATGIPGDHPAADPGQWPTAELAGATSVLEDLDRFEDLPTGAWAQPPTQALLVPLVQASGAEPAGFLVAALDRYRPVDTAYRGFVELIAGQLAAGIASARAYQAERHRAEALAELDRAKTAFFTNVSHELRTPLTLMLGPAEDALADRATPLPGEQHHRVEVMHRNAQRLLKLVNTLLDFSRLESGATVSRRELTDLAGWTTELAGTFSDAVARAGLTLTVDCPPLPRPVWVDREMWAKIVLNLLSNALKFTFTGGIRVALATRDDSCELTVADTGIGVDPAQQGRLFERFHRVDGARGRSHEGSGIGLALVAELTALHGGRVGLTSTPGRGSTFTVVIPMDPAPPDAPGGGTAACPDGPSLASGYLAEALRWLEPTEQPTEQPTATGPAAEAATPAPSQRPHPAHLLVVDDNADLREYLARLLGGGYRISTASDGVQALAVARADLPDLVLTDVMMPGLDGLGLVRALRDDPVTALVPVIVLSARAGPEAATDGLEAGADDYLVKPFSAGELRARVRANLELDRTRRAREELERSRALLDQAQRLAGVGSWELDLATGALTGSEEYRRQLGAPQRPGVLDWSADFDRALHPDDAERLRAALEAASRGAGLDLEIRLVGRDGVTRDYRTIGELERGPDGHPARLRGSNQDVTEQRHAERALAAATASREVAAREHRIADELQRSLLPDPTFNPHHLRLATYYRAGAEGTQVGGDWFDVIELGADRTALVIGDVMGRGVRAAAVMGQLRAAVRAYARLDLPPADLLEYIDALVRELGEDQIVTCLYAVYDPGERTLRYANAGHLPPLVASAGEPVRRLTGAAGPPLGSGPLALTEECLPLATGSTLVLYTDGLVEHRERDIDTGIDLLAEHLAGLRAPFEQVPTVLVDRLVPEVPDDDIAVLAAHVTADAWRPDRVERLVPAQERAVGEARTFAASTLHGWRLPARVIEDVVLLVSELVTNAVLHGRPPVELRLRPTPTHVVIEVHDSAPFLPRKLRPTPDDEHGRGLQLVALLTDRWGTRPTPDGKAVWCVVSCGPSGS